MYQNDDLRIYRGEDFVVNEPIKIHQPTLGEICDFGEQRYFSFVYTITATPTDFKYQLSQSGLDWNEVDDFALFRMIYKGLAPEDTCIIFNDLNFRDYQEGHMEQNGEPCLFNPHTGSTIDKSIYEIIVGYLRKTHRFTKNVERAMNQTTKDVLLEEAKEQIETAKNKPYKSTLIPLISTLITMGWCNYNHSDIWDMKINAFMDSIARTQKIKNADLLLQGGYSGNVDLSKIKNKKELNYFSELA